MPELVPSSSFRTPAANRVRPGVAPVFTGRVPSWPVRAADALVWLYQRTLSPALLALNPNCGCRFSPTCSQYARDALHERGLVTGSFLTLVRLVKCGPWHPGGEDQVPPRRTPVCRKVSPV